MSEPRHAQCADKERFRCPCWQSGAREEAEVRLSRPATRELTDCIRALGDFDPAMSSREVADRIVAIFGTPHVCDHSGCIPRDTFDEVEAFMRGLLVGQKHLSDAMVRRFHTARWPEEAGS